MKRVFIAFLGFCLTLYVGAQPARSRVAQNNQRLANANKSNVTSRAALMFPTAVDVPDDVAWRRDIYRFLDLTKDENAALYYPIEPHDGKINLFTLLFQLFSKGQIPVYNYDQSGLENFSKENRMHFREFLDRYEIDYQINGNSIDVIPGSIPSSSVKGYYVKESSYYDQNTSTYHSRVVALCPVLFDLSFDNSMMYDNYNDSFGDEEDDMGDDMAINSEKQSKDEMYAKKPMFWVKLSDVEAYLSQHMVMTSNINNAAVMSMADFFATNKYKGDIYMTNNMQGKTLEEVATSRQLASRKEQKPATVVEKEQNYIEKQLVDFEQHIWTAPVDSAELAKKDSIAAAKQNSSKTRRTVEKASRTNTRSTARASRKKEKSPSSSGSSGNAPRVSVRRQRH